MRQVNLPAYGGPEVLTMTAGPEPEAGPGELLVRVRAAGVNRADCLQRAGAYPMPPGLGNVPGLEVAGEVVGTGPGAGAFAAGDRVFALVAEGGYAEYAAVDEGLAVPMPAHWSFAEAAAVIEVYCTANETVFELGGLESGRSMLVHAGASGVGTAAVQMASHVGATVHFTAGTRFKIDRVLELGAHHGILYKTEDFVEEVLRVTRGEGVDVVEDFIGAAYLARNLAVLKPAGTLVLVGLMGGQVTPFDLGGMLRKRLTVRGFTLRAQPIANKRAIVARFRERWLPLLAAGALAPVVHAVVPFADVRRAHEMMEANENFGKIILALD